MPFLPTTHNTARLQIKGFWGLRSHSSLSFNALSDDAWKMAQRRGLLSGLKRYTLEGNAASGQSSTQSPGEPLPPAALGFAYRNIFPDTWNALANWTSNGAANSALIAAPNPFYANDGAGLFYANATKDTPDSFTSQHRIIANQAHTLRISFAKVPGDQTAAIWRYCWDKWRFEVRDEAARIVRFGPNYTLANDQALDALLAQKTLSSSDNDTVAALRKTLFCIDEDVALPNGSEGEFHQPATLTFLPEARGVLRIECAETKAAVTIPIPSIQKTRKPGTLWNASTFSIQTNGGAFVWQSGRPDFTRHATFGLGQYLAGFAFGDGDMRVSKNADLTFPNTNVTFANTTVAAGDAGVTNDVDEIVATFTGDGLGTPYLYSAQVFVPGGERDGSDAVVYDTNDHLDSAGCPPILEITPQLEGQMQASSYTVHLNFSDIDLMPGLAATTGDLPYLIGRMCDLTINGALALGSGIILKVHFTELADPTINKSGTCLELEIGDLWHVLDEDVMNDDPVGDNLPLSWYTGVALWGAGLKGSERGELSGDFSYAPIFGRTLPSAALGEAPCVRPQAGTMRGAFLRGLIEKYGLGLILTFLGNLGQFDLVTPSTAIKASFSTDSNAPSTTYPIFGAVDVSFDPSDCYNAFCVQGAIDPVTGQPITKYAFLYESLHTPSSPNYLGRVRWYPTVCDSDLKTAADVNWVIRSLIKKYGRGGRFLQFSTYYISTLRPDDYITVNGQTCQIERIPDGSWSGLGEMTIVARVLS